MSFSQTHVILEVRNTSHSLFGAMMIYAVVCEEEEVSTRTTFFAWLHLD